MSLLLSNRSSHKYLHIKIQGKEMRKEKDALGEIEMPDNAYYGVQAFRSIANFDVTNKTFNDYPNIVNALAEIKKACALANRDIGVLEKGKANAIINACDDILEGRMNGQFPVNIWRGGGTSINMNVNEVIANRANEILTGHKGYDQIHPNTHVNMCQSSNDVYPSAENIVLYREIGRTLEGVKKLENVLNKKAKEFEKIVRLGRTCLQDGVPMTLGQVFAGFHGVIYRGRKRLEKIRDIFRNAVLGGTVLGTGIGIQPGYVEAVYPHLNAILGFEMHLPDNPPECSIEDAGLFDAMQNSDNMLALSGVLKLLACSAGKIANDLRLLSSGPRSGFKEITLPAVAPGSSIMPGKINPFMCDLIVQIMHQVTANDVSITMNTTIGDLDLAFNSTVSFFANLQSLEIIGNGFSLFSDKCVSGITANENITRSYAELSTSLATVISTLYGYEKGSQVAAKAFDEGISCKEAALREKIINPQEADDLFDLLKLSTRSGNAELFKKYKSKIS